jgi:hypothetical protein
VRLFEYAGNVKAEPGDHVAILRATWDLHPPGERTNYSETLERRYAVIEDGRLSLEYDASQPPKKRSRGEKAKRRTRKSESE